MAVFHAARRGCSRRSSLTGCPAPRIARAAGAVVLAGLLPLLVTAGARAAAYEGFGYPVNQSGTVYNGGTGFSDSWSLIAPDQIRSGSLSDPTGTLATSGNRLGSTTTSGPGANIRARRHIPQTIGASGTDLWVSWLMRRSRADEPAVIGPYQGLHVYEFGANRPGYFIGEPGFGPMDGMLVVGKAGDDPNVVSSGVPFTPNQTVFMVAHFSFVQGNDAVTLFVNPTPGAAPPTGGVTYSGFDFSPANADFTLEASNSTDPPAVLEFDEPRIGSTYAEVAPVPEPSVAVIVVGALWALLARRGRHAGNRPRPSVGGETRISKPLDPSAG